MAMTSAVWTSKWSPFKPDPYPLLKGAIAGLIIGAIPVAILVILSHDDQIRAEQYRWLSAQVQSHPEIRGQVSKYLADDGTISRWEYWTLKKQTEPQAVEEARAALARQLAR